ncbi:hypothetical protein QTG54_001334 [Skeletonema marinoi]|uniref:Uncharacterized protein n=1 Tax=Skeletonema marinoi TaxID=267567 RepID=A0AAD9DGX5_9STRA|nr:hypothetical protein QTG54_001334 [Skeletonema marinoi]
MLLHKALQLTALLGALSAANASLTAVPSAGVNILDDVDSQGINFGGRIQVVSNVPVNLDNYYGSGTLFNGAPLEWGQVKVLVTSNCDTSQHDIQSKIAMDDAAGTSHSFDAKWTKSDFWCEQQQFTEPAFPSPTEPAAASDGCSFCMNPKTGICDDSQANCFIDPCDVPDACGEGQKCKANYCGGCHAICSGDPGIATATTATKPATPATFPLDDGSTCEPNAALPLAEAIVVGGTTTEATAAAPATTVPPQTTEIPDDKSGDPNSLGGVDGSPAFTQQRCFAASFVVLVLVCLLLPGRDNNAQGWMGFGAVAVVAVALSAGVPKKTGIARNSVERPRAHARGLQETCSFNVEILYDGCSQAIIVDAPSARVVDVSLEDYTSTDAGDCVTDYDVTLAFPVTDTTKELELPVNNTVDTLPEFSDKCAMVKMDSLASVSWSGEIVVGAESISSSDNVTDHNRFLLGDEWTERGLGEHASVASFSAFSIALMTNNAPSDLVEDALKAGMDEIRHARTSFEVATKLVGKPVGPGPLPPSTHKFGDDLTSLALAVAREGCVDETLSAIVADLEVEDISRVLEEGIQGNLYSNIERDTLAWIKNEMQTIAKEESSHAALAWRTLNWVCNIDSDACEAVHRDVFDEASLEVRFNQRAMNALSDTSTVRNKLKEDFAKLLEVHLNVRSNSDMSHVKKSICDESEDSLGDIPAAVLRGMIC